MLLQNYESVRSDIRSQGQLPDLKHNLAETASIDNTRSTIIASFNDLLKVLVDMQKGVADMLPSIQRFRKRLSERDPVTGSLRYGAKTKTRVVSVITAYEELDQIITSMFESEEDDRDALIEANFIKGLKAQAIQEQNDAEESARLAAKEEQNRLDQIAKEKLEQLRAQQSAEEESKREMERKEEENRRQRQEARDAELRAREEAARADRAWVRGIPRGQDGVKQQLMTLIASTQHDPSAQRNAVEALHLIFSQICSHPEEANYRRVRRNHPKFNQDIGQYDGGKEFLIAAGFEIGEIDGVPSFISKEPNLETEMDRWSEWFDLLKETLRILEEQIKCL